MEWLACASSIRVIFAKERRAFHFRTFCWLGVGQLRSAGGEQALPLSVLPKNNSHTRAQATCSTLKHPWITNKVTYVSLGYMHNEMNLTLAQTDMGNFSVLTKVQDRTEMWRFPFFPDCTVKRRIQNQNVYVRNLRNFAYFWKYMYILFLDSALHEDCAWHRMCWDMKGHYPLRVSVLLLQALIGSNSCWGIN